MPIVYWVRTNDITEHSDGYIGVTSKSKEYRLKQHLKSGRFAKYGRDHQLIIECIFEGSSKECFDFELSLRPTERIGWNIAPGAEGGFKGNHYVSNHGMPWREKINKKIRDNYSSGKREPWNKGKPGSQVAWNKGTSTRTKPYKEYKIQNVLTKEVFTLYGQHQVAEKIGLSASSANKIISGKEVKCCQYIRI